MESPFPGMDPYLESPLDWPGILLRLNVAICNQIQPFLSPNYVTDIVPYEAEERVEGIDYPLPARYSWVVVRKPRTEAVVTLIGVLSPINKRPEASDHDPYAQKRAEVLPGDIHLLEIDLLRAGHRPTLPAPLPESAYSVLLSRANERPKFKIWPITLADPLPIIPVPLRYPDADVPLDLGAALRHIYTTGRYDLSIDYRQPPPAPDLTPSEAQWLDHLLHERGLR